MMMKSVRRSGLSRSKRGLIVERLEGRRLLAAELSGARQGLALEYVPNELLVQYVAPASSVQRNQARVDLGAGLAETIHTKTMQQSGLGVLERLTLPRGVGMERAMEGLKRNPNVLYVEPNYIYRPAAVSNDTYYVNGSLWGMYSDDSPASGPTGTTNQFGSHAEKAWQENVTGSASVVVGVIDEGIQVNHPDLVDNIWVNPHEIAGDGVDNDGNGYIDDIHGWDFVYNNNSVYDTGEDAHGTHVAGTIGGTGGNGAGVVGVNWDVTMISLKFLGPNGGSTANAVKALDYLTDLKNRHGINVVASNNSWGGGGYSQTLHDAIIRSAKKDILFVAAAGNSTTNNDATASYPSNYNTTIGTSTQTAASYDSVIAVASITSTGAISSFSSYGATTVDIGAPGSGIWSSVPSNTYASYNGTSMATPHVTGAIALYASTQSAGASAASIKQAVLESATPTTSLAGKTVTGGRLNVYEALRRGTSIGLDNSVYSVPATIGLTVNHPAANLSSTIADTITVTVQSTTESTPEQVVLTETGLNTGRFAGSIQTAAGAPAADGQLQAVHGDQITAYYAAINKSAVATVDTVAPTISSISSTPASTSSEIRWSTSEAATSEVLYGTSADNLDQNYSSASRVSSHLATLTGLTPSTLYYYAVRSRDAAGNISTADVRSFTTSAPAPILFVDDDLGATYERFYTAALNANAYAFDSWNVASLGRTPTAAELGQYSVVIWNTGFNFDGPGAGLSGNGEQEAISGYLNGGGRILISGQDVLYSGVSTTFRQNYLKVANFVNDVVSVNHTETGVAGNLVSNGLSLPLAKPSDYPSLYVDAVSPVAGAEGTFQHGVTTAAYPFAAINYRGDYAAGGFGMVFMTFPFESISTTAANPNNQAAVLQRAVEYLTAGPAPSIQVSTPTPSSTTTEAGGSVSFTVVLGAAPTANVSVTVVSSDTSEGTVGTSELVFTPTNWNVSQTVTVTGVDDAVDDGNVGYTILLGAAVSDDPRYSGIDPADVNLTNQDNDTAGITVANLSGTATTEDGESVSFTIRLDSEPTTNVTIPVSSSDTTEGVVSLSSLVFTPTNWNVTQSVTVTGVDDAIYDGDISYTIVLGAATSGDALYNGRNPADVSLVNLDNDPAPATKFFVVNDAATNRNYEYDSAGGAVENYLLASANTTPRGVVTNVAGDRVWVVDNNRTVYVYNNSGGLLGSWVAGSLPSNAIVEGIATNGTHVWIVDNRGDRVYYYANAASRTSGTQNATSNFLLNSSNRNPKDIVTDGSFLWVVNDGSPDRVFRYNLSGALQNSWTLNTANKVPTGITLDPSGGSQDMWVVDSGTDRVYRYANARTLTAPTLTSFFQLAAGNANPQGIADPPAAEALRSFEVFVDPASAAVVDFPAEADAIPALLWVSTQGAEIPTDAAYDLCIPAARHELTERASSMAIAVEERVEGPLPAQVEIPAMAVTQPRDRAAVESTVLTLAELHDLVFAQLGAEGTSFR